MRIGAAQIASDTDRVKNLAQVSEIVSEAKVAGVDLLVLPEYCSYFDAGEFGRGFTENAESIEDGPFVTALRTLAAENRMRLVAGMLETAPDEPSRVFNTVVVVSPEGKVELAYRKIHLYDAFGGSESTFLVHGDPAQEPVFEVDGIRFAVSTCYDMRFPEIFRRTDGAGPEVLLLPAVWTPGPLKSMHWDTLTRARAIENIAYMVAVTPPAPESIGQSRMLNPDGTTRGEAGAQRALLVDDLDPHAVRAERSRNTSLDNRRYRVIGDKR